MRPGIGRNASCASGDWLTSRPKGCSQPRQLWFFDILMYIIVFWLYQNLLVLCLPACKWNWHTLSQHQHYYQQPGHVIRKKRRQGYTQSRAQTPTDLVSCPDPTQMDTFLDIILEQGFVTKPHPSTLLHSIHSAHIFTFLKSEI